MGTAPPRTLGLSAPQAGLGARRAAAVLLAEVLDHGRTLDDAMGESRSFGVLEGRDRAFARAIVSAALRRLGTIDAELAKHLARPLPTEAALPRSILRTGAAQLMVLRSPAHAAVSESVSLARSSSKTAPFAGLINAVLRRVAQAPEAPAVPGVDLPAWLYTRWRAAYGDAAAAEIALALNHEPPLDLTMKRGDAADWADRLGGVALSDTTVRLSDAADVTTLDGYADGAWWVQDAAAAQATPLLGDVAGLDVLDMCAAPGGKTMQLAAAGARVTALDISAPRLERLRANLTRAGLDADVVCADALRWETERQFDVVVVDAPCTATGTLRRHPEAAWLRKPHDILAMTGAQHALLAAAARLTRPGGRVLYAVCSLEPEEGEGLIEAHAADLGLRPVGPVLRTTPASRIADGGMDGFYAHVLCRA